MNIGEKWLGRGLSLVKSLPHNHECLSSDPHFPHNQLNTLTQKFSKTHIRKEQKEGTLKSLSSKLQFKRLDLSAIAQRQHQDLGKSLVLRIVDSFCEQKRHVWFYFLKKQYVLCGTFVFYQIQCSCSQLFTEGRRLAEMCFLFVPLPPALPFYNPLIRGQFVGTKTLCAQCLP